MGGCISNHASSKDTSKLVLQILAEVNFLPATSSTEPQQWQRLFHSLVPVTLRYTQDDDGVFVYTTSASGVNGSSFTANIRVPGTELHKTSPCFIHWCEGGEGEGERGGGDGGGVLWGLNFMSGDDAMKFLKACTPPTFTPESKEKRYSLPITHHHIDPPPPLPSQDSTHRLSDSFESVESDTHSYHDEFDSNSPIPHSGNQHGYEIGTHNDTELEATGVDTATQPYTHTSIPPYTQSGMETIPPQTTNNTDEMPHPQITSSSEVIVHEVGDRRSDLIDVEGDGEDSEDDSQGLYEPASPLQLMPTGILQDIAEETEGDIEYEHSWNVKEGDTVTVVEVEYAETGFFDSITDDDSPITRDDMTNQLNETPPTPTVAPPPSLPVSPPPGPVLSPRLSMLLAEASATNSTTTHTNNSEDHTNRLSVVSLSGEAPPPLPSSLPPGKLISPRHSLMDNEVGGRPNSILGNMRTGLDVALLSQKILTTQSDSKDEENLGSIPGQNIDQSNQPEWNGVEPDNESNAEEPLLITTIDEVDDPPENLIDDFHEPLPPPIGSADEDTPNHITAKLKIAPSFLRSLEPPAEFSDSGFPDTDHENTHLSTPEQGVGIKNGSSTASDDKMTGTLSTGGEGAERSSTSDTEQDIAVTSERREDPGDKKEENTATFSTIRKTGWLELKAMLVRKNRKVAMKSKRRWRRFWATLKGSSLLFSVREDERLTTDDDLPVDTKLDLSLSLAHAVHDHVKRDYIFCLSTANGNTYYLQTTSVSEMEDWISNIHSAAAVAMTNHSNKEEAMQMIKSQIEELNITIEKETQLKNLTELKLTTVTDYNTRSMATKQLVTYAENIERYNVEIYRLRCYLASLHGTELPNPQTLLASIARPTKVALGKVGVFSVASLHAVVSARSIPSSTSSYSSFRFGRVNKPTISSSSNDGSSKGKSHKHKTFPRSSTGSKTSSKSSSLRKLEISGPYPMLPASTLQSLAQSYSEMEETTDTEVPPFSPDRVHFPSSPVIKVITHGNRFVSVAIHDDTTIKDVLHAVCRQRQIEYKDHFIRLRLDRVDGEFECEIPGIQELLRDQEYTNVELCQKWTHTVILSQPDIQHSTHTAFGLMLEPVWDTGGKRLEMVIVSRIEEGGVADRCGVWEGDEVMRVNGRPVREAGWVGTRSSLDAASVSLTLKTCHIEMPISEVTNQIVESLICPAPPPSSHTELSPEAIRQLTVPTPTRDDGVENSKRYSGTFSREQIDTLLKDSYELSKLLKSWDIQRAKEESSSTPWTQEDRLRKSAQDLLDTEREYIRLLHLLVEQYLEPLKTETFISQDDREALEGNTLEVLEFQTTFLQGLEEAMTLETAPTDVASGDSTLKHVMFAIASTFLVHMESFRMYSTFCASHYKIKQLLDTGECSAELSEFLEARNPRQDHSISLPALFAKPIVRLARYPLFLNAMIDNSPANSEERSHLTDVVEGMACVANYINEMQRVSETYCSLFHAILIENSTIICQPLVNLSLPQLRYHGEVMWLNPSSEETRAAVIKTSWKKGQGPHTTCFVFASAVVLTCVDKKMKRRHSTKSLEVEISVDDTKFRILLPSIYCSVHDLPDSDGVTNMWQIKYKPPQQRSLPTNSSPTLTSPLSPSSSSQHIIYLLRSQSMEQKATMVHLIRQSITEQSEMNGGDTSSLPPPSPIHHHHNSHSTPSHSPLHKHFSSSSPRHQRPRSHSQPHLPYYTPPLHPSPLSHSQLPSLPSLPSLTDLD